jgi:integrase
MNAEERAGRYPNSKSWRIWLADLKMKKPKTRELYLDRVVDFFERTGYDPESFFKLKLDSTKSSDPRDATAAEAVVKSYISKKREDGFAPNTIRLGVTAISSLMESQNLPLNMKRKGVSRVSVNGTTVIQKSEIRAILTRPGKYYERNLALGLAAKDTGGRVSDLSNMRVGHYLNAPVYHNEKGEPFKCFEHFIQKTESIGVPHFGPESVEAVDKYLEARRKTGDPLPLESPLFLDEDLGLMTANAISSQFRRMTRRVRGSKKLSAHSFRKFFQTSMEVAGMEANWIKRIIGKAGGGDSGSTFVYSLPQELAEAGQPSELTKGYMEAYDSIRIYDQTSIKDVQDQLDRLHRENEELKADSGRMETLESQVQELTAMLKIIYEDPELAKRHKK